MSLQYLFSNPRQRWILSLLIGVVSMTLPTESFGQTESSGQTENRAGQSAAAEANNRQDPAANSGNNRRERDSGWQAKGQSGAIATGSRRSADAGLAMLQAGGNAADAAVTSLLVQSVVESQLFCFGGELPIIIYNAERKTVEVIVGLGAAPELATSDWFEANRKGVIQGRDDVANAVVPGVLDACLVALERHGTRSFAQCAEAMLAVLSERAAMTVEQVQAARGRRNESLAPEAWIRHHQNFHKLIQRLVTAEQTASDRMQGLRRVRDYFYRGPVARELDAWSQANGGLLRFSDLARHHTRVDEPLTIDFADYTIYKCGVWSQGPFLLQTLEMLEPYDLTKWTRHSPEYIHTITEAMKLCFADRDAYLGDPEFVEVPIGPMLSSNYLEMRRGLIDPQRASQDQIAGDPRTPAPILGIPPQDHKITSGKSDDTSNCLVADQWGNVVSATPSGWGGVIAGDTGIELGSRMIGLTCWENHPSELMPGKRPRITLTPTLVCRDGKPVFAVSVAGGDQQDQASIQILLNRLIYGMEPAEAVRSGRFSTEHHINWFGHEPFKPGTLQVTRDIEAEVVAALKQRGHQVSVGGTAGRAVVLSIDPATGEKHAAGDQGRFAAGY